MSDELFSRSDIYETAKTEWQLPEELEETDRDKTLRQISRTLKSKGIESSEVDTDGHTKLYKLPSGVRAFVRDEMHAYFMKTMIRDSPLKYSAASISDDEVGTWQGIAEDQRIQDLTDAMKGKPWPNNSDEELIQAEFEKRKYQIMIEAIFNEKFVLHEEDLLNDIRATLRFTDEGDSEYIKRDMVAVFKRENEATFYYNRRAHNVENKE